MNNGHDSNSAGRTKTYAESFRDLVVYQRAHEAEVQVFRLSAGFPREEAHSLTIQIRRSSRAIGAHIAEAWGRRRYRRAFILRLADAGAEGLETEHWIHVAETCGYLTAEQSRDLLAKLAEVGRMLHSMIQKADRFCSLIPR